MARLFVSILRRALTEHTQWTPKRNATRKRLEKFVFVKRISHAVRCFRALLSRPGQIRRMLGLSVRRCAPQFQIDTDASPYGFDRMVICHHGSPEANWAESLSDDELSRFGAVEGDPAWPAGWELLAILISLHVFRMESVESRAQIVVQSDSLADLSVA